MFISPSGALSPFISASILSWLIPVSLFTPAFEVMTMMQSEKRTVSPFPSVSLPSPKICRNLSSTDL